MKQEADIADRQFRDLADFFVTEVTLKFEVHDFTLILRQGLNQPKDLSDGFLLFEIGIDTDLGVFKRGHASLPFSRIEGEIAANREEPLDQVSFDLCLGFAAQS